MSPSHRRPPYGETGTRLGLAVLGFIAAVVGAITLQPFRFRVPAAFEPMGWSGWFDALANVALFLPLGFVYALTRAARTATVEPRPAAALAADRRRTLLLALAGGAAASLVIETVQVFEPGRYPSPIDVATNALGALLGAWLHARTARALGADTPLVGRLALELPVTGLLYVTLPVCTLAAVGAAADGAPRLVGAAPRVVGLLLLAAFGGVLIGTIQRRQLGPARAIHPGMGALAAAAWFAAGALPGFATTPRTMLGGTVLAALTAWDLGRRRSAPGAAERRFEAEALARAAPFYAGYLVLLPLGDPVRGVDLLTKLGILRQVETLAAFTVGGYLVAEAWSRRELRYRNTVWRVGAVAALATALLAVARLNHGGAPAAPGALVAQVVAAAFGGWLFHLQRAHVRALVEARRGAAAAPEGTPGAPSRAA